MLLPRTMTPSRVEEIAEAAIDARLHDWWETYDGSTLITTGAATANFLYLRRIDNITPTTDTISHYHTTATGNVLHGLYTFDGATFTRRAVSASTALAGSNTRQDIALTTTFERMDDVIHYGAFNNDGGGTFQRQGGVSTLVNAIGRKSFQLNAGSLTMPATIALGDLTPSLVSIWLAGA